MKKLFGLLMVLFILYFSLQILFVYIGSGHTISYEIKNSDNVFVIHEQFRANNKKDADNYSISIDINNTTFNLMIYEDFKNSSEIIKEIKYYEDEQYKCIFVKYRNDLVLNDVLCNNGSYTLTYHSIVNPSNYLTNFVDSLKEYGYEKSNWEDNIGDIYKTKDAKLYIKNIIDNHYVGVIHNNNLYYVNMDDNIKLSNIKTQSANPIHAFTANSYVVKDYNDSTNKKYYVYSLKSATKTTIISNEEIYEPKVLGTYGNSLFIFDNKNKIEYEIDIETQKVLESGNSETNIKYYSEGEWKYEKLENLDLNNLNFGSEYSNDLFNVDYDRTMKIGHEYGYYYYFKKVGNNYQVYRSNIGNDDNVTYLFTTSNMDSVQFADNYIYYIENGNMRYYNDKYGNRTLFTIDNMSNDSLYKVYVETKKA